MHREPVKINTRPNYVIQLFEHSWISYNNCRGFFYFNQNIVDISASVCIVLKRYLSQLFLLSLLTTQARLNTSIIDELFMSSFEKSAAVVTN